MSVNLTISNREFRKANDESAFALSSKRVVASKHAESGLAGFIGIAVVVGILGLTLYLAWAYLI